MAGGTSAADYITASANVFLLRAVLLSIQHSTMVDEKMFAGGWAHHRYCLSLNKIGIFF